MSGSPSTRYPWGDRPLGREDILDREQVGELLGLRRRRGDLPAIRLGRHRRFLRADVEQFVVANRS